MDYSLPDSSVHGILQARTLEWLAISPPPGVLPNPGMEPASLGSPALAGEFFTTVLPGKPVLGLKKIQISFEVTFWASHRRDAQCTGRGGLCLNEAISTLP